jgi:magnesium chelatase family protein
MSSKAVKKYCPLHPEAKLVLQQALRQTMLSARSYYKVVKVARTIADLDGKATIRDAHVKEAWTYRPPEAKRF